MLQTGEGELQGLPGWEDLAHWGRQGCWVSRAGWKHQRQERRELLSQGKRQRGANPPTQKNLVRTEGVCHLELSRSSG